MPYGGTTPEQDKKIDSCISKIKGSNPRTKKPYTSSEKISICKAQVSGKSFMFSEGLQVKTEGDNYVIEGVISTTSPDLGKDIVTDSALEQMASIINTASTKGVPLPVGFEHTELLGGHPNLVPIGNFNSAWVEDGKLYAKATINQDLAVFDEVKSALERRDIHSFSIEYVAGKTESVFLNGIEHRKILDLDALVGVAITGRPMNPEAVMAFAAKNLNFEKLNKVVKVNKEKIQAPIEVKEEDVKPEEEEKKPEEEEAPKEEMKDASEVTTTSGKSTVEISSTRYNRLKELEAKEAAEAEERKYKSMFEKYFKEIAGSQMPSGAPQMNGEKFSSPSVMPNEVKNWQKSLDSNNSDVMYRAAAKLVDYYEGKGVSFGTTSRPVMRTFFKNDSTAAETNQSFASSKFQLKTVELKAQVEHDTDRTTSGSEYYLSGPLLNDIFGPAVVTHLNELNTTYSILRKEDASNYGDTYGFRFKYARSTSATNYDESATDNPTAQATSRKKAHIPFVWYRTIGQVSGPTIAAARGQGGIGDAFALEVRDQTEELIFKINTDLFDSSSPSDGMTRGGQMLSLVYLVDDSTNQTTLYGHTRTAGNFTTLQGNLTAKSNTPNPTKDDLRLMINTVLSNGARREDLVFITEFTQHRKILNFLDDAQRYNNSTNPVAGFDGGISFDGVPLFADASCTAGYIYLLDLRHTFLAVQLPPTMEELAQLGDYRKFHIKTYFALVSTAPNHNYMITGYATS